MNELMMDLDFHRKTALYEQIYTYIRCSILDGRLSPGERLPSARQLAASLQVSRSTVDAAYGQLTGEGYLKAVRGSGFYVCDSSSLYDFTRKTKLSEPKKRQTQVHTEAEADISAHPDGRYCFLPGQIDSGSFPYNAWRRCSREALLELEAKNQLLQAGHPQGEYELRRTIAGYLYRARGVNSVPEQIVIGAGNEYLLQLLGQILGNTRSVAMESPTYLQAYHTFQNMGCRVHAAAMDADGILVEEIPEEETLLVYVMPSHQFPLGCVMPLARRLKLLAWAQEKQGRYIIEDDHDSEFRYKGRPIPSLQGMAQQEKVIYLGTFSNSIMPSIRISYMVLPKELLPVYQAECGFYASTVSKIQQMTVCRFIDTGCFERHLNKMRGIYKGKRDLLLQLLKEKDWVYDIYGDYAGLHIAVELNCSLTEDEVIRRAARQGLKTAGMWECYIAGKKKPDKNPILLLGFGNLSHQQIREGIGILDQILK